MRRHNDIRQSDYFARYLNHIGWTIETIESWHVFIRPFPLIGSLVKIQRVGESIALAKIDQLAKKYRAFRVILELNNESGIRNYELERFGFRKSSNSYAPSKTIQIDLTATKEKIFEQLTEAKRRGVRRAVKHKIVIEESSDIDAFIKLKWGKNPFFFWLVRGNQKKLWQAFARNATVLFAYRRPHPSLLLQGEGNPLLIGEGKGEVIGKPMAGILLLFHDKVSYYWQAAATKTGKKLFAPTLLVWEALKLSKKRGCTRFDFEGIYDERFPSKTAEKWKGFTKFKQGFGGKEIYYPAPWVWSKF